MSPFYQGFATGAGLIVAIGAQNAFVLAQGVRKQYQWVVAAICSGCDALLIWIGVAGVGTVVASQPMLRSATAWGGAAFLFYYGCRSLREVFADNVLEAQGIQSQSRLAVISTTLAVTLLNPHVYLDTMVLLGGISGQFPGNGRYRFALGASTASLVWFFSLSLGGILLAPLFRKASAWRILHTMVWLTMWTIAFQLVMAGLNG